MSNKHTRNLTKSSVQAVTSLPVGENGLELPQHWPTVTGNAVSTPKLRDRISMTELKRRLWHMAPGLLVVLSWSIPHKDPLSPTFKFIAGGIIMGLALLLLRRWHTVVRKGETHNLGAVFGYAVSVLATLLLFPAHAELGMAVLVVLAFGDGSATLGGLILRGPALPWNSQKTWAGTLSFIIVGAPLTVLAYWAESQPKADWAAATACGITAVLVAAFAESIPSRINDNIRVGIAASAGVAITHAVAVGM